MAEKKNRRWIALVVVSIATLAFVAVPIVTSISGVVNMQKQATSTPSPSPSGSPGSTAAELADQARGYEAVLQREPDNQTALRGLVDVKIKQGDIQGIIPPLEKLAALNPDQPDYTVLLAQAKRQTGDREGAAQAFREILKTRPGDLNALKGLTDLLLQDNRPEAAVGLLQDTLKTAEEANQAKPGTIDTANVQLLLAEVYALQTRYDEAIGLYDRIIASNAQDFRPVLGKAFVFQTQGKTEEAKPLFTKAESLAPPEFKDRIRQLATAPSPSPSPQASPAAPDSPAPAVSPIVPEASPAPSPAPAQ
ncbi:tetratricopeptide repeat protein [Leptolyngbya ohadii]|uniref:tetratricopeptide repeat protein n=1 Tax=Leptolyngbya ohadii TaxID=1962290 RepID=UPI000B59A130|nr:tetratricopeptide repeat protein [Leptolyngbya ohadii]